MRRFWKLSSLDGFRGEFPSFSLAWGLTSSVLVHTITIYFVAG
jgi:hypothetical protein